MDNYEKLEIKLDTMNETMRSMLDLNRQTLTEIKKQNDVMGSRLSRIERDIEKASESRKEIYERIEKIEHRCAVRETALPIGAQCSSKIDFGAEAKSWIMSEVGRITIGVLLILVGAFSSEALKILIEIIKAMLRR
ncbi:hypothetical protein FACS1894187_24380 [Synergistales bacterium]|nr:hypothetical protein FACS1894187_24380 [Synergistales bacterium]